MVINLDQAGWGIGAHIIEDYKANSDLRSYKNPQFRWNNRLKQKP